MQEHVHLKRDLKVPPDYHACIQPSVALQSHLVDFLTCLWLCCYANYHITTNFVTSDVAKMLALS